ncbi:sensor histidine kinase [Thauera phenolivorans]|nr:ATP-binding protein [Thauera phenolivorans]
MPDLPPFAPPPAFLPGSDALILCRLAQDEPEWDEIAFIAAHDPGLSLRLLQAEPLAAGELERGLLTALARRLQALGDDLLRAWLLADESAPGALPAAAAQAPLTAACALLLARETGYPRPDEALLGGLWAPFALSAQPAPAWWAACGLPPVLLDALAIGRLDAAALAGVHPLARLLQLASRLADRDAEAVALPLASVFELAPERLLALRADAAARLTRDDGPAPRARVPPLAPLADDPYRAAAVLGLLGASFARLAPRALAGRLAIACRLFGLRDTPLLVGAGTGGLLRALPGSPAPLARLFDELKLRATDPHTIVAQTLHDGVERSIFPVAAGSAAADSQLARWLGARGLLCLPLARRAAVALIGMDAGHDPEPGLRWLQLRLLDTALAALHAASALERERETRDEVFRLGFRERHRRLVHEASNPLTVIRNRLELIALRHPDDAALQQETALIGGELERVDALLRRGVDPPQGSQERPSCDAAGVVEEMRAVYAGPLFEARGVGFELQVAQRPATVAMPASALRQVLLNLFRNAAEALGPGRALTVTLTGEIIAGGRNCLELSLVDDGPGLPSARRTALFDAGASSKGEAHQGVGLAVVKEIIDRWHGSIVCRSPHGGGTTFQLLIPLDRSDAVLASCDTDASHGLDSLTSE